jgi:hypothetical protein
VSLPSMGSFTITIGIMLLNDNMRSNCSTCGTTHAPNEIDWLHGFLTSACFLCTTDHIETVSCDIFFKNTASPCWSINIIAST